MTLYQLHKLLGVQQKLLGDFDCLFASVVASVFTCSLINGRILMLYLTTLFNYIGLSPGNNFEWSFGKDAEGIVLGSLLWYYPRTCLEELGKTIKNFIHLPKYRARIRFRNLRMRN